jgi:hypothetical protein
MSEIGDTSRENDANFNQLNQISTNLAKSTTPGKLLGFHSSPASHKNAWRQACHARAEAVRRFSKRSPKPGELFGRVRHPEKENLEFQKITIRENQECSSSDEAIKTREASVVLSPRFSFPG